MLNVPTLLFADLNKQITDFSNTEFIQLAGVSDIFMNYGLKNIKLEQGKSLCFCQGIQGP